MTRLTRRLVFTIAILLWCSPLAAQVPWAPGFIETKGLLFPQETPNDTTQAVADLLWRQELIAKPTSWLQFVAGGDFRANTHDQVEDVWRVDWEDRGPRPPRISVRRLAATVTAGRLTLDLGKQFIRWARADVLNPIDRFAPRDYTNVIDTEFLPVIGGRATLQLGPETIEAVWLPQLTPSRMPLLTQRWSIVPAEAAGVSIIDLGSDFTNRGQAGARRRHNRQPLRDRTVVRRWIQPPPGDRGAPTRRHRHRGLSRAHVSAHPLVWSGVRRPDSLDHAQSRRRVLRVT